MEPQLCMDLRGAFDDDVAAVDLQKPAEWTRCVGTTRLPAVPSVVIEPCCGASNR